MSEEPAAPGRAPAKGRKRKRPEGDERQRDLLRQIGQKELELDALVQEAKGAAEQIIERARREAEAMIRQARETAAAGLEQELENNLGEAAVQAKEIMGAAAREAERIKRDAEGRVDEAAQRILDALMPPAPQAGEGR